jgi:hypothetical protein
MNIFQKLGVIQNELDVPKTKYNEFGKYSYRTVEMILEQLKPLLQKQECVLRFNDELIITAESTYVKSTVILSDEGTGEDKPIAQQVVHAFGFAREPKEQKGMNASQITSSATSFARKNALTALFLLDDSEEEDSFNVGSEDEFQELIIKLNKAQNELSKLGVDFREDEKTKAWIESRTGLKTQDLGTIAKSVKDIAKCRVLLNAYDVLIQGKKLNEKDK